LFLRGLGLGNCTDWLRLSVLNSARRDLRCLSQFLITGDTVCSLIFFRLQYSDSNHSANFFAPLLVLHAAQHLTTQVVRVLLYRMNGSVRSSERAVNVSCNPSWIIPGTRLGRHVAATAIVGSGQCFKTSSKLARQLSRIARGCIWSTGLGILELRPSPDTRKLSRPLRLHILIAFCISDQILRGSSFYKLIWVGTTLPSRNESYCRIRITVAIAGKLPP
jgi:hypothetical protein